MLRLAFELVLYIVRLVMRTRPVIILALILTCLFGLNVSITPIQAQAIPPINPFCWIADKNNPAVQKNCKGHDWNWPHWGGGSGSDSYQRGCGGGTILSQTQRLNEAELNWFRHRGIWTDYGTSQVQLVLVGVQKKAIRFRPDKHIYTWQQQTVYEVWYQNRFQKRHVIAGNSSKIEC